MNGTLTLVFSPSGNATSLRGATISEAAVLLLAFDDSLELVSLVLHYLSLHLHYRQGKLGILCLMWVCHWSLGVYYMLIVFG